MAEMRIFMELDGNLYEAIKGGGCGSCVFDDEGRCESVGTFILDSEGVCVDIPGTYVGAMHWRLIHE